MMWAIANLLFQGQTHQVVVPSTFPCRIGIPIPDHPLGMIAICAFNTEFDRYEATQQPFLFIGSMLGN